MWGCTMAFLLGRAPSEDEPSEAINRQKQTSLWIFTLTFTTVKFWSSTRGGKKKFHCYTKQLARGQRLRVFTTV